MPRNKINNGEYEEEIKPAEKRRREREALFINSAKEKFGDKLDYSKVHYTTNRSNVTIACPKHGEFEQTPESHLRYSGCPQCSAENLYMTTEQFIAKAKKVHGDRYDYTKTNYKASGERLTITCRVHGDFTPVANAHLSGYNCPYCGKTGKDTKEEFIAKASKVHDNKYDYSKVVMGKSSDKVEIICPIHGSFYQLRNEHIAGKGCRACGNNTTLTTREYIEKCIDTHGSLYDYSKTDYKSGKQPVTVICKLHGEFITNAGNHARGSGCPRCTTVGRYASNRAGENFARKANIVHSNRYTYNNFVYKDAITPGLITCKIHGDFEQTPQIHLRGNGCQTCTMTKVEHRIAEFLKEHGIDFIYEYKFKGSRLSYDFFLPDYDILIEYNGVQHYKSINYFGGLEALRKQVDNDYRKKDLAFFNDKTLLIISYKVEDTALAVLKRKLRDVYKYWLKDKNGNITVYKNMKELCSSRNVKINKIEELKAYLVKMNETILF